MTFTDRPVAIIRSQQPIQRRVVEELQRAFNEVNMRAILVEGMDIEVVQPSLLWRRLAIVAAFVVGAVLGRWAL